MHEEYDPVCKRAWMGDRLESSPRKRLADAILCMCTMCFIGIAIKQLLFVHPTFHCSQLHAMSVFKKIINIIISRPNVNGLLSVHNLVKNY